MMKKKINQAILKGFSVVFLVVFLCSPGWTKVAIQGSVAMPQPPAENPHPPQTPEDQRRVDFAVQQIRAKYGAGPEIRWPHVIPWSYQNFLKNRKKQGVSGAPARPLRESEQQAQERAMAPSLKPDEYMVHAYVLLPDGWWHHVDVIMSESEGPSGLQFVLRGFFEMRMPLPTVHMPKGVVC